MSVLTGITGAVRSQIAGRLNSAIGGGLRSGVGSLTGTAKEAATSALGSIDKTQKFTTKVMSYPENVANDPQSGHFILFQINEFTDGKLKSQKTKKAFNEVLDTIYSEAAAGGYELNAREAGKRANDRISGSSKVAADTPAGVTKGRKSLIAQKPKKRLSAAISLYMPPSVTVKYDVGYKDSEIGTLAMLGSDAIKAFTSGKDTASALSSVIDSLSSTGAEGLKGAALSAIDVVAQGAKALVNLETGKVVTPRMEMMFENVGRRDFSFTFAFIPKSAKEAKSIKDIIYTFKENMMPEFVEGSSREMKIPNTFDITYMYHNQENKFINKISTCFLKNLDVTYGGDRFTAYDPIDGSPPPQKSSITLSFSEIETMSKALIKQGY
jgi:hypothetical protein